MFIEVEERVRNKRNGTEQTEVKLVDKPDSVCSVFFRVFRTLSPLLFTNFLEMRAGKRVCKPLPLERQYARFSLDLSSLNSNSRPAPDL